MIFTLNVCERDSVGMEKGRLDWTYFIKGGILAECQNGLSPI